MGPAALLFIAPFVGSFLGVLVRRLPRGESVVAPRSHCETCARPLGAGELVPIASFVALGGRCAACSAPIGRDHLLIELAATLVPAIALASLPFAGWEQILAASILGWVLLALAWIDALHWILPDALTLTLLLAGLAATWTLDPTDLLDHAIAAVASFAGLRLLAAAYARIRGRDGLGFGDAKLLAAGGTWCGLAALPSVLLGASLLGLGVALARHGRKLGAASAIPFGPPLCLAIWAIYLWQARFGLMGFGQMGLGQVRLGWPA